MSKKNETKRLEVRTTAEDLEAWRKAADVDDRRTLADWLRWLAHERIKKLFSQR